MKKTKWNWLDTLIVCIVLAVIIAACVILFNPRSSGSATSDETDIYVTFDTVRKEAEAYDNLKIGDEIMLVDSGKTFGVIESIELVPHQGSTFNEQTKKLEVYTNEDLLVARLSIKTKGYRTDRNEVFVGNKQIKYTDELVLETRAMRVAGIIIEIRGGEADE